MSHPEELKRLNAEMASHLPHLSKSMLYVLALYVLGMVITRHCGQTQIATMLSGLVRCQFGTMKQRLREFTYAAQHKRGDKRCTVEVERCFAPLLGWVLSKFAGDQQQVVLALDATYLKDRFVILAVSVVVAGGAIPVAWHIQKGDQVGAWNPIWLALLAQLRPGVPPGWTVFVLTDSGLYSKTLYRKLDKTCKWRVLMRIAGSQGLFKARGTRRWRPLRELTQRGMKPLVVPGQCFKGKPLTCTLIVQWAADYDQPCLIVTNLPPQNVQPNVYGIRYWIECGFKDIKRGLFHWEQTKMTCPQRAERLWLVISIALLWLTALGDAASNLPHWTGLRHARSQKRILSTPVLGWIDFILTLLKGRPLTYGHFNPYPWLPLPEP
jgi:hypothetical protein